MKTKKMVVLAVLTAVALTIYVIEAQVPPLAAIPGIKLGLANVVTLFALVFLSRRDAALILILRVILGSIFAGQAVSFLYSMAGGLFCLGIEIVCLRFLEDQKIWVVSIFGAIAHNAAQTACAALITMTPSVFWYLPYLLISAVITGAFTGLCVQYLRLRCRGTIERMLK